MWTCRFIFRASTNKSSWPFFFFFWSKPIHFQVNFESSRNLHMKGRGTRLGDGWPRKEKKKKKIILNEERKKRKKKRMKAAWMDKHRPLTLADDPVLSLFLRLGFLYFFFYWFFVVSYPTLAASCVLLLFFLWVTSSERLGNEWDRIFGLVYLWGKGPKREKEKEKKVKMRIGQKGHTGTRTKRRVISSRRSGREQNIRPRTRGVNVSIKAHLSTLKGDAPCHCLSFFFSFFFVLWGPDVFTLKKKTSPYVC